jgi:hypothetical protein
MTVSESESDCSAEDEVLETLKLNNTKTRRKPVKKASVS